MSCTGLADKPGGLSTDTSRDYEYTDWEEVRRFAEDFLKRLVPQEASKINSDRDRAGAQPTD